MFYHILVYLWTRNTLCRNASFYLYSHELIVLFYNLFDAYEYGGKAFIILYSLDILEQKRTSFALIAVGNTGCTLIPQQLYWKCGFQYELQVDVFAVRFMNEHKNLTNYVIGKLDNIFRYFFFTIKWSKY